MKVIINKVLPLGRDFYAINLFGVIFAKGPCSRHTLNHESIHTYQQREMLYLPFYIVYLIEWFIRILQTGSALKGYHAISFEREAYANDSDYNYHKKRKPYAWLRYMRRPK